MSASELSGLSRSLHQPVYWAGSQGKSEFELTRNGRDQITVRAGTLAVGTYRVPGALAAVRRSGKEPGSKLHRLPRGGLAVVGQAGTDVHFAYPSKPFQVEVFDPAPGRALELVTSGAVKPVP